MPLELRWLARATARIQVAVDVRTKSRLFLGHVDHCGQAEELKTAAVGEDRAVPTHEGMQAAEPLNELFARAQREMVGICQHHLSARDADLVDGQSFDRCDSADGHEGGKLDRAMGCVKRASARVRARIGVMESKGERRNDIATTSKKTIGIANAGSAAYRIRGRPTKCLSKLKTASRIAGRWRAIHSHIAGIGVPARSEQTEKCTQSTYDVQNVEPANARTRHGSKHCPQYISQRRDR